MATDERWKVNLFIAHPCWFIYHSVSSHQTELQRSATSRKVLQLSEPSVPNLCNLELAHWIYYQYYLVDCIFVIVQLLCSLFDLLIQFIDGHSCIRNNIINVPVPTLEEYNLFSLSSQYIESTKTYLVKSVIIQKKLFRSNAKLNIVNIVDTEATILHLQTYN